MWEPLVTASSIRRKETSEGERPGLVGLDGRICEMWIGRPRSVERTSRRGSAWCEVKRSGGCDVLILADYLCRRYRNTMTVRSALLCAAVAVVQDCEAVEKT